MNIKYMVASPGRSGSIFITLAVSRSLGLMPVFDNQGFDTSSTRSMILHTHDAMLQLPNDPVVICPSRDNLFKEVCSAVIAEHYNEWYDYTDNHQPFVADLDQFDVKYIWHKRWLEAFEHYTKYTNKIYLKFEEFIGNSVKLCQLLGIPPVEYVSKPSPRRPEQCIINFQQIKDRFVELESDLALKQIPVEYYNWKDHKKP